MKRVVWQHVLSRENIVDARGVVKAISKLVRDREPANKLGKNGERLSVRHNVENFRRMLREEVFSEPPSVSSR